MRRELAALKAQMNAMQQQPPQVVVHAGAAGNQAGVLAAAVLVLFFLVDLSVYVLLGATPLSPMGNVSTWLVWRFRGNAVWNIPYKVVFVVYLAALVRLLSPLLAVLADGGGDDAQVAQLWQPHAAEHRAVLLGGIINSSMLAVLRF